MQWTNQLAFCLIQYISKFVSADDVLSFLEAIILSSYCRIKGTETLSNFFSLNMTFSLAFYRSLVLWLLIFFYNKWWIIKKIKFFKFFPFLFVAKKMKLGWKDKSIFRNLWIGFPHHKWMDIIFLFRTNYHSLKSNFFVPILSMLQLKFVKIQAGIHIYTF